MKYFKAKGSIDQVLDKKARLLIRFLLSTSLRMRQIFMRQSADGAQTQFDEAQCPFIILQVDHPPLTYTYNGGRLSFPNFCFLRSYDNDVKTRKFIDHVYNFDSFHSLDSIHLNIINDMIIKHYSRQIIECIKRWKCKMN